MMSGRMNVPTSASPGGDDFPFAPPMPPPPPTYVGSFEHGERGGGGVQQQHLYDGLDFAAAALQFQQQQEAPHAHHHHHQLLTLPSSLGPMAPPPPVMPMPMPMQMPMVPGMMPGSEHHVYPALGMVKREGGGGGGGGADAAGRIGLNLGRRTYFSPGDMLAVDRLLMRSRLGGVFGLGFGGAHHQPPRCQAEGCKADLSGAKHYHRRHKVCEYHAKASVVAAAGKQQRFCQQCSRFHVLSEFDEVKRSCRKRLAEHNRRRRKPATTASSKDAAAASSPPGNKKPNAGSITTSYSTENKNMSTAKPTMSSNTSSVISCLDHQAGNKHQLARPTLTLGAPQDKDHHQQQQQQLSTMLHVQAAGGSHHHQEQHFITSLQVHNNGGGGGGNNMLSCSSVCSSALASANGEVSDQNTTNNNNGNGNGNNMHNLFEVDFM